MDLNGTGSSSMMQGIQVGEEHPQQLNGHDDLVTHIITEENAVTSKSKEPAKGKKVARRGSGFSKEEDKIICSAFLNISKDPITGVNGILFIQFCGLF